MSSFLTKIKTSGRLFFTSGFFTLDLESNIFVPQSNSKLKFQSKLLPTNPTTFTFAVRISIVKILNYLINVFLTVSGKYNTIGCFFVFFLFRLKVGVHTFLHEWCIHSQLFGRLLLGEIKKKQPILHTIPGFIFNSILMEIGLLARPP
jgi:hypothetical protein